MCTESPGNIICMLLKAYEACERGFSELTSVLGWMTESWLTQS